jgi:predicted dehydrogenase
MTHTLRIATVGAGYFSQFHYDGWSRIAGVHLEALCALDRAEAEVAAKHYGVPRAFGEIEAMLDEVRPDLLDIITPPATHLALVRAAARRGIGVICQKPLAPTLAEAEELVRVAEDADILLVVHENFRFMPWFRQARELIDQGRLGPLHSVHFRLRPGDGQGSEAYLGRQPYFQKMERFLIHETGIHFIDSFRYLMGEVSAVTARLRRINPAIAGEDTGYVVFEFASGATGLFDGNRLNDHVAQDYRLTMGEMHLEGERGVLRLDGSGRLWWKPQGGAEAQEPYDWTARGFAGDCVHALQNHVVRHLRDGAPLMNRGRDYLANMTIEEAIYQSHDQGRRIELPQVAPDRE